MGQPGLEVAESVGGGVGFAGVRRDLLRVDVEVQGQRVVRLFGQHGLEHLDDLVGAGLGLAVVGPEVPGAEVHQGLGVKRADVGVPRVLLPDRAHGVCKRPVQRFPVGGLGIGVSLREGVDQRALDGTRPGGALAGLCQGFRPLVGV